MTKSPIVAWGALAGYMAAIVYLSHQSSPFNWTFPVPWLDGVAHAAEYALLSLLAAHAVKTHPSPWWRGHAVHGAVLIVAVFGLTDELHQALIPGRSCEWSDWLADVAGGWLAQMAWVGWEP